MKGRRAKAIALAVMVGGLAALAFTTVALGVFSTSQGVLADSNTVNAVNFNVDPIKLRTKDSVRIRVVHTVRPGGTVFGWHTHPGTRCTGTSRNAKENTSWEVEIVRFGPEKPVIKKRPFDTEAEQHSSQGFAPIL